MSFILISLFAHVPAFMANTMVHNSCPFKVGDLALTIPRAQMKVDAIEAEINAEGIGQTHLRFLAWCLT